MEVVSVADRTANRHFLSAFFRGHFRRFAHFEMAENVLEHDDGVIDQARKSQCQSAEDHGVDGASARAESQKRRQGRERDGKEYGRRGAQAAEEKKNHQAGENEADASFADQIVDRCLDENRLVEHDLRDELFRNVDEVLQRVLEFPATTAIVLVSPPCFRIGK